MSTGMIESLKQQLSDAGLSPRHAFGQNFMVDVDAVELLASAAEAGERVLEIGPGTGLLTRALLEKRAQVCAVELDKGMHALVSKTYACDELTVIHGDALVSKTVFHEGIVAFTAEQPWSLIANLPYSVSIPIILNATQLPNPPRCIQVTIQKEAAERLCAEADSPFWGASAAVAQAAGTGSILRILRPSSFWPRPRVDSAILQWVPERSLPEGFAVWCRGIFAYRRKVITRALRDLQKSHNKKTPFTREMALDICTQAQVDETRRLESLSVDELLAVFTASK